jgi:hypothetical protein
MNATATHVAEYRLISAYVYFSESTGAVMIRYRGEQPVVATIAALEAIDAAKKRLG